MSKRTSNQPASSHRVDAVIVGGGVAGLWLLNRLKERGYSVLLLEADRLGNGQTLASQGMIHGGLKYALGGALNRASEAIADMPARWRACLNGTGELDLRAVPVASEQNLLFADASSLGRLTTFFAAKALRGRIRKLADAEVPKMLGADVSVYTLDDLVIDSRALIEALQQPVAEQLYEHRLTADEITPVDAGYRLQLGTTVVDTRRLLLCAGTGNSALLDGLGVTSPRTQRRPLAQVIVRQAALPPLFGHCLTDIRGPEPRLTISSHRDGDGWLWYLGGQLAGDGVNLGDDELKTRARSELAHCLPNLDLTGAELEVLRVDRAEPCYDGRRPDNACAIASDGLIVCWPVKLSLAPDLGERVLRLLDAPAGLPTPQLALPPAQAGLVPWAS